MSDCFCKAKNRKQSYFLQYKKLFTSLTNVVEMHIFNMVMWFEYLRANDMINKIINRCTEYPLRENRCDSPVL